MSDNIPLRLHSREVPLSKSLIKNERNTPLLHGAIGDLLKFANDVYKNDIAYICHESGESVTFGSIYEQAVIFARGLLQLGLQSGDRIGILSGGSVRWVVTFWGATLAGLTVVPMFVMSTSQELVEGLRKVDVNALVCSAGWRKQDYYEIISKISPELFEETPRENSASNILPALKHLIFMDNINRVGTSTWNDINCLGRDADPEMIVDWNNPALFIFTSGTTGVPKVIPISHFSLLNANALEPKKPEASSTKRKQIVRIIEPPMGGISNISLGFILAAITGDTVIIPAPFPDGIKICEAIEKHKVQILSCGTLSLLAMLDHKDHYDFSSMKHINVSGMVIPRHLSAEIESTFSHIKVRQVYGSTESLSIAMGSLNDTKEMRHGNSGYPTQGVEIKIVGGDGEIAVIEGIGDVYVRSEVIMKGYWNNEEATKDVLTDNGWYRTGDVGYLDKNGYIYLQGRLKDVIKRREFTVKIFPSEVEVAIDSHPKVYDSCVFSINDDVRHTQLVGAAVILLPNQHSHANEIQTFLSEILSDFKIPDYIIFVDTFPRTGTGKVRVNDLREMLSERCIRK